MIKRIIGGILVGIVVIILAMIIIHFVMGINIPYWPFTTF